MTLDKKIILRLKVLYVEDDDSIRSELTLVLLKFFGKVYTAKDGEDGLLVYKKHKNSIDLIISDINMPKLTGIEMLKEIRKIDKNIPIMFTTAYSDTQFYSEAIKLKVYEYLIKPIDIRNLIEVTSTLAQTLYNDFLLEQQKNELQKYTNIILDNNIVIKTDNKMKITYVNELFCSTTNYNKDELLNQSLDSLFHGDVDPKISQKIQVSVLSNNTWKGIIKNKTNFNTNYVAECTIISSLNDAGDVIGSICIQKDITKEINQQRDVKISLMKDKGNIFIKSKKDEILTTQKINKLEQKIRELQKSFSLEITKNDLDVYSHEKAILENKQLKREIMQYKKDYLSLNSDKSSFMKLSKDNTDYRMKNKKLLLSLKSIDEKYLKEAKQTSVNYEIKIDDLEKELNKVKSGFDNLDNPEALMDKLRYWKEKAKDELEKTQNLEKQVLKHADANVLSKLFGQRSKF